MSMHGGTIHQLKTTKYPPNEDIILICRRLLRDAKSGKIQGFAFSATIVDDSGDGENGKCNEYSLCYSNGWGQALYSGVLSLFARIIEIKIIHTKDIPDSPLANEDE